MNSASVGRWILQSIRHILVYRLDIHIQYNKVTIFQIFFHVGQMSEAYSQVNKPEKGIRSISSVEYEFQSSSHFEQRR
jgi:hypothetical protein